jgi:tRNA/rRNA methyltransferase
MDLNISIILVEPESSGNMGSVARIMKNFAFNQLILFNPQEDPHCDYAFGFSMHGKDILKQATIIKCALGEELAELKALFQKFDVIISTSAKGVNYKNIKRIPVFIRELDLDILEPTSRIGLVFGRESTGLTNEELILTDFSIRIPSNPEYATLNLSHAVGIVLYELYSKIKTVKRAQVIPASKKDKDLLNDLIENVMKRIPLQSYRYERSYHAFKNLLGRAFISKKELTLIYGIFNKLEVILLGKLSKDENSEDENSKDEILTNLEKK